LLSLAIIKAANPDIVDDCSYDCPLEVETCEASGECLNFVTYFANDTRSTSYDTSASFETAAGEYCVIVNGSGSTIDRCDTSTTDLIDCIAASTCWMSTTEYSTDCDYYASIVANFSITSAQTTATLCQANWGSFFDNYFGNDYVTVSVILPTVYCPSMSSRRVLLQSEGESSESSESESESESESTDNVIVIQIAVTFYSEASYTLFYNKLDASTFISGFEDAGYITNTRLEIICLTTTCCDSGVGVCTQSYDDVMCNETITTTGSPQFSGAISYQPLIFLILSVVASAALF